MGKHETKKSKIMIMVVIYPSRQGMIKIKLEKKIVIQTSQYVCLKRYIQSEFTVECHVKYRIQCEMRELFFASGIVLCIRHSKQSG